MNCLLPTLPRRLCKMRMISSRESPFSRMVRTRKKMRMSRLTSLKSRSRAALPLGLFESKRASISLMWNWSGELAPRLVPRSRRNNHAKGPQALGWSWFVALVQGLRRLALRFDYTTNPSPLDITTWFSECRPNIGLRRPLEISPITPIRL